MTERIYKREEKREYEKMYEATTGKVTHKILIELDDQCENKLRELSQDCGKSMQEIASGMVTQHLLNHILADKRYERVQTRRAE